MKTTNQFCGHKINNKLTREIVRIYETEAGRLKLTEKDAERALFFFYDAPGHDMRLTRILSTKDPIDLRLSALHALCAARDGKVGIPWKGTTGWTVKRQTRAQGRAHYDRLIAAAKGEG